MSRAGEFPRFSWENIVVGFRVLRRWEQLWASRGSHGRTSWLDWPHGEFASVAAVRDASGRGKGLGPRPASVAPVRGESGSTGPVRSMVVEALRWSGQARSRPTSRPPGRACIRARATPPAWGRNGLHDAGHTLRVERAGGGCAGHRSHANRPLSSSWRYLGGLRQDARGRGKRHHDRVPGASWRLRRSAQRRRRSMTSARLRGACPSQGRPCGPRAHGDSLEAPKTVCRRSMQPSFSTPHRVPSRPSPRHVDSSLPPPEAGFMLCRESLWLDPSRRRVSTR